MFVVNKEKNSLNDFERLAFCFPEHDDAVAYAQSVALDLAVNLDGELFEKETCDGSVEYVFCSQDAVYKVFVEGEEH